jgi:hypothetical protein
MEASDKERPRESEVSSLVGNLEVSATTQEQPDLPVKPRNEERSKCERSHGPSDGDEGGGDGQRSKEDVVIWRRDAKWMIRATKKFAHDLLRSTREDARANDPKPEKKNIKTCMTMNDRVGLQFLKHWNATRREMHVGIDTGS